MRNTGGFRIQAKWDKRLVHKFCDLCIREIEIGNRPGMRLTTIGWHNVLSNFAKETGRGYGLKQLKNKWDMLKRDQKLWKLLLENETGIKWNPRKDTLDASSNWWTEKIKVLPEARRFQRHGIDPELEQKLDKMFTVVCDLDEYAPVPSDTDEPDYYDEPQHPRKRKSCDNSFWREKSQRMKFVADPIPSESIIIKNPLEKTIPLESSPKVDGVVDPIPSEPIIRKDPVEKTMSPASSLKVDGVVDPNPRPINRADRLSDEFESRSTSIKCDHTCSITDAIQLLDSISEVPKASPLYYFAIKLILNKDKREVFMALTPETKVWWLKMEEEESRKSN